MAFEGNYFKLSSTGETIVLTFETRNMEGKLPSVLTFAYYILSNISLSFLACAKVSVNNGVTCFTNRVITSRHDCAFENV